ncbi:hypothetical protein A4A49_43773 [Nicotiana attenuata]|uniref:Uncharacterized protein n=1 Tax=Nicotiana attenuata TaxID=49451 RepID=A0A1J6KH14_NICAT|nr:hypothetical protein A4A49_43773 [Nicotiana attenuata]
MMKSKLFFCFLQQVLERRMIEGIAEGEIGGDYKAENRILTNQLIVTKILCGGSRLILQFHSSPVFYNSIKIGSFPAVKMNK